MRILAAALIRGVSITLAEESDGWRFVSWTSEGIGFLHASPMPDPPVDACARRFDDYETAIECFRGICPLPK